MQGCRSQFRTLQRHLPNSSAKEGQEGSRLHSLLQLIWPLESKTGSLRQDVGIRSKLKKARDQHLSKNSSDGHHHRDSQRRGGAAVSKTE